MTIRGKLSAGAQPFLEPGETVTQAVPGQLGHPGILATVTPVAIVVAIAIWDKGNGHAFISGLVFVAVAGGLATLLLEPFRKPRAIIVTDRAILLLKLRRFVAKPESLIIRLPRDTPLRSGPTVEFLAWSKVNLYSEALWVHRRYRSDVETADAAIPPARPDL